MTEDVEKLIKAFNLLGNVEKREFAQAFRKLGHSGAQRRNRQPKALSRNINFSPPPGRCPQCGR